MLDQAFNLLLNFRGKLGTLKRLGSPDLYSPARIADSNYSRLLSGPENTTIKGIEFVLSAQSFLGSNTVEAEFFAEPTDGTFTITVNGFTSDDLDFAITPEDLQLAVRALDASLVTVVVGGTELENFTLKFYGIKAKPTVSFNTDDLDTTILAAALYEPWPDPIPKRGDRIIDEKHGRTYSILEVIEMSEAGGNVIGYRLRCD